MVDCFIVGVFGRLTEANYEFIDEDLIVYTQNHNQEYFINTNDVTGIAYEFHGHTNKSYVTIESNNYPQYLSLKVNNYDLINDFTVNNKFFERHSKKIKEGLPEWSYNIWLMTPYIRKLIQYALVCIEMMIFLWTMCSLLTELDYNFLSPKIYSVWKKYLMFLSRLFVLVKLPVSSQLSIIKTRKIFNLSYLCSCLNKIYVLIKTPKTGELGRKINNLKESKEKKD